MRTAVLLYGDAGEVSNELCSCNEPEAVKHVDLIAALGNALNRITVLEKAVRDLKFSQRKSANDFSCTLNGIVPD